MDKIDKNQSIWTPANIVTMVRICAVPLFVAAVLSPWPSWFGYIWSDAELWKEWIAAAIFIVLAATDGLDGYLARSRDEVTNFGKFIDPLADKILVAAALLSLIELGVLPSWVAIVILSREFIVSGIRMLAATQGVVIAASWTGKAKTVMQIIAIVLFIIKDSHMVSSVSEVLSDRLYLVSWAVMIVALILTIVSMLDYFAKAKPIFKPSSQDEVHQESKSDEEVFEEALCGRAHMILQESERRSLQLGFAESCTGGLVCSLLSAIPGSSKVLAGGVVSYSNSVKSMVLEVKEESLNQYGAVSEVVAREMAEGAYSKLGVNLALSVTGIAGPDGGSKEKPVGTVWIGVCDASGSWAKRFHFEGNRNDIRVQTLSKVLDELEYAIKKYPKNEQCL